jgi:signal peptidase complex subunit 1
VGYVQQNIYLTLWIGLLGAGISFLMVVPPWPVYNEDPEPWFKSTDGANQTNIVVDGKKVN